MSGPNDFRSAPFYPKAVKRKSCWVTCPHLVCNNYQADIQKEWGKCRNGSHSGETEIGRSTQPLDQATVGTHSLAASPGFSQAHNGNRRGIANLRIRRLLETFRDAADACAYDPFLESEAGVDLDSVASTPPATPAVSFLEGAGTASLLAAAGSFLVDIQASSNTLQYRFVELHGAFR